MRFKEYNKAYNEDKIGDIFSVQNGLNKDKDSFGFGYPIVNYMDVNKNVVLNKSQILGRVNITHNELTTFKVKPSDILITRTSETVDEIAFSSCVVDDIDNLVFSGFLLKLSPINNNFYAPYFAYLFRSPIYRLKLMRYATVTSRALMNSNNLNKIIVKYPKLDEQKRIYSLMYLIEGKITILNSKIKALKKYKEGICRNILNRRISSKTQPLNNYCKINTGKLDANAMKPNGKYKFFTCSKEDYLIDDYAFDCEAILVAGNGEVGHTKYYKGKFNAYQRTYVLYDFKVDPILIKTCIDLQINSVIKKETNKGAMPYIKLGTFSKIKIPELDKTMINSLKILKSLDKKIDLLEKSLNQFELIKQYLLRNLFI